MPIKFALFVNKQIRYADKIYTIKFRSKIRYGHRYVSIEVPAYISSVPCVSEIAR